MNATVILDDLIYSLNVNEKTASVIGEKKKLKKDIFIPRSIIFEEKEYIITSISEKAFCGRGNLRSVQFPPDSEILIIDRSAFDSSSIEEIKIPPSLTTIGSFALSGCQNLTIEIPINSNLQQIKCGAFVWCTKIEQIYIPPKVKEISFRCFNFCKNLKKIIIPKNSELETIKSNAFDVSSIECITIPTKLVNLVDMWCIRTPKVKKIDIFPDNPLFSPYKGEFILQRSSADQKNFRVLAFSVRNIEKVIIPSFIETIENYAFSQCKRFKSIEFEKNSQLRRIGRFSFFKCKNLRSVDFPSNSKIKQIDENAFAETSINCFTIPPELTVIHKNAFNMKLQIIEIDEDSQLNLIPAFFLSCEILMIPQKFRKRIVKKTH